jgi:molecular chaperone GrpE
MPPNPGFSAMFWKLSIISGALWSFQTVGQQFNPELHEAILQIASEEHPEGVIAQELAAGFKKGEKVIRHSKVGVSTGKVKKE